MKQIVRTMLWGALVAAGPLLAQVNPLNLDLPQRQAHYGPDPASASSSAQPGVYYGDHSNASSDVAANDQHVPAPDRKTHVSGSVSTGFYSGSRGMGSGVWNAAQLNVSKPVGDNSLINISVGISKMNNFGGRPGWGGAY